MWCDWIDPIPRCQAENLVLRCPKIRSYTRLLVPSRAEGRMLFMVIVFGGDIDELTERQLQMFRREDSVSRK